MDDLPQESELDSQVMEEELYGVAQNSENTEVVDPRPDQIKPLSTYGELLELEGKNETFVLHPLAQLLKDG